MRKIVICTALILLSSVLHAQSQKGILISAQQKVSPDLELYNKNYSSLTPWEVEVSVYNLEISPLEAGAYLSGGYPSSVDFAYGLNLAYLHPINNAQLLKAGLNAGRFKMGSFNDTVEVGAIMEDEYHESFKPFLEWQWDFTRYFSFFSQASYRFIRTETGVVEEILSRYENGSPKSYRVDRDTDFCGSGFEFGAGISVRIH